MKTIYCTNQNLIFTHEEKATLDVLETEIKGEAVWTGPFPYASWEKPPAHKETECAVLAGDKWEIRKRIAGTYWHKETREKVEIQDPFDEIEQYTNLEPPQVKDDDKLEFKDGKWVLKMGAESLAAFREHHRSRVKKECEERILEKYSRDKQMNVVLSGDPKELTEMRRFINAQLSECQNLKDKISKVSQKALEDL